MSESQAVSLEHVAEARRGARRGLSVSLAILGLGALAFGACFAFYLQASVAAPLFALILAASTVPYFVKNYRAQGRHFTDIESRLRRGESIAISDLKRIAGERVAREKA